MFARLIKFTGFVTILCLGLYSEQDSYSQPPASVPADNAPAVPPGVEVMARGPVHEAFAAPIAEPKPSPFLARKPPAPIEEMPPEEKPEGDVVWISGYWSWDDDRNDYLWVSGCWRAKPPGKEWVAGYWREQGDNWQWVAGFWANVQAQQAQPNPVTYYPQPPAAPPVAPPGEPPSADSFYVPGNWVWVEGRYGWRAGYWTRVRAGYVWVPAHYRWTPYGYVYIAGYWDLAIPRRGVLYAPVVVNFGLIGPRFVYTPAYAVCDTIVLDALFIRPAYCHYYFGDYYGPRYVGLGFESCVVYSRRHYEPIIVYARWENRANPAWLSVQVNLTAARNAGRAPLPPRTLVQQNTIINNVTNVTNITNNTTNITKNVTTNNVTRVLAPTKVVTAARGQATVPVAPAARTQAMQAARTAQSTAIQQRRQTEVATPGQAFAKPRTASLNVPSLPSGKQSSTFTNPGGNNHPATGPGNRSTNTPGSRPPSTTVPGNPPVTNNIGNRPPATKLPANPPTSIKGPANVSPSNGPGSRPPGTNTLPGPRPTSPGASGRPPQPAPPSRPQPKKERPKHEPH